MMKIKLQLVLEEAFNLTANFLVKSPMLFESNARAAATA